ncbi:MAG: aminoacyl-tRNA hydrolase, partial [Chlamydiales bacterium]
MSKGSLIVGLGNPGKKYENSRHNLGFMVVKAFAAKRGWDFKRGWRFKGYIAHGDIEEKIVHLLLPVTYMNLSGKSVRKVLEYYKIARNRLLVVVDDVNLALGVMRIRPEGSSGGHNGLKSIEESLKTREYTRFRIGVGR